MELTIMGLLLFVLVLADTELDPQIFKGQEAVKGQFPYHAGVISAFPEGGYLICGGSLISETWIITAAHCVDMVPLEHITAFLGSVNIAEGTRRRLLNKIVHPDWNEKDVLLGNDIALLEIKSIANSETIKNITLPTLSDDSPNYEGHTVVVSGWGLVNKTSISLILQYTNLVVYPLADCKKLYFPNNVSENIICAQDTAGSTVCQGDSGGPLVDVDSKILIGITSFGLVADCGSTPLGNGFTDVSVYRQWIYDNTGI